MGRRYFSEFVELTDHAFKCKFCSKDYGRHDPARVAWQIFHLAKAHESAAENCQLVPEDVTKHMRRCFESFMKTENVDEGPHDKYGGVRSLMKDIQNKMAKLDESTTNAKLASITKAKLDNINAKFDSIIPVINNINAKFDNMKAKLDAFIALHAAPAPPPLPPNV